MNLFCGFRFSNEIYYSFFRFNFQQQTIKQLATLTTQQILLHFPFVRIGVDQ